MPKNHDFLNVILPAPFGSVGIHLQDHRLHLITLHGEPLTDRAFNTLASNADLACPDLDLQQAIGQQLQNYFQHAQTRFSLPLMIQGTGFQQRVWQAIASIPLGQTRTYSQLAESIGSGPRAVANACGANPYPLLIPCHRVVARTGIGGFMQGHPQGLVIKRWLLAHECAHFASSC